MKPLIRLRREVGHGGRVPRGWQLAWYEPRRRVGIYYPQPLHWILRALRELGYRLRLAARAPRMECAQVFEMQRLHRDRQKLADEYARGYMCGWNECFHACLETVQEEIAHSRDIWDLGAMFTEEGGPERPQN
jgi:hypothetical protein